MEITELKYNTDKNIDQLILNLISLGFEIVADNNIQLKVNENLYISIITDYKVGSLWVQFRLKNFRYISEINSTDAYCTTFAEILTAMADYAHESGYTEHQNIIKTALKLN